MQSEQKQKFEGQLYPITNDPQPDENSGLVLSLTTEYLNESEIHVTEPLKNINVEHQPTRIKEIMQAIFMADHDAAQLEQYLLENDTRRDAKGSSNDLRKKS